MLFGLFGGGGRRKSTPMRPKRRRSAPGAARYLERVARMQATSDRARSARAQGRQRPSDAGYDDPTVPIPRQAQRAAEAAHRRREADERAREKLDEQRARAREAKQMEKVLRAREKAVMAYMTIGLTRTEAEREVDRQPHYEEINPRRRASRRSERRNPGLGSVVGEITKEVVKGGLVAAAQEEAKEWRTRLHQGASLSSAARAELREHGIGRRRRNPARPEPNHPDPRLREMSMRFHGTPTEILHLDPDQRRPPPTHVVKIGEERATTYRPSRRSERGDADWEHEAGDRGPLRRNLAGRRLIVADEHGNVYMVQGSSRMRFDPDAGLVG